MAYADQKMSGNRITALIIVALIHILVIYALVTGLAYEAAKKVIQKVTTVDIKEEVKKEEPPPPPPKKDLPPPPIVAPPPKISLAPPPPVLTVSEPPPPAPPPPIILAPPAPPPPPPSAPPKAATPKGNPGSWATSNDYPARALREEREGVAGFRVGVGPDGRVTDCQITSSSGHADLDQATCDNVRRRARFNPAMENGQPTTGTYSGRIRWQIPKD